MTNDMDIEKIIQEEMEDFDWTSDFYFTKDIIEELLSDCKNVPIAIYNNTTDRPYIKRGKDVTVYFLSLCDYWWENATEDTEEWFDNWPPKIIRGIFRSPGPARVVERSERIALLMPYATKFKLNLNTTDLPAITVIMKDVLSHLNGDNPNEFWFLVNEDGTPKYDLIPLKHIDKAKNYEKYLNNMGSSVLKGNKLNESKELKWIEDISTIATGTFFMPNDVCFNSEDDCSVNINIDDGEIIFSISFDDWVDEVDIDYDDTPFLKPYLKYDGYFDGNEDYYDLDLDEFNYVGTKINEEQIEKLQKIFDIITPDLDVRTYIDEDRFSRLRAKLMDYEEKSSILPDLTRPQLTELWDILEYNVIEQIGYTLAKNKWLEGGLYYKNLLSRHNVNFDLKREFLKITIPVEKLFDYLNTMGVDNTPSLTDFMHRISNILTDVSWHDGWYEDWDTSGSEDGIRREFDRFIDSVNEFFKKQNINESDMGWIEEIEPFYEVREGDYVRVINMGSRDEFLDWLGDYEDSYLMGGYGTEIEGIVDSVSRHDTFNLREKNIGDLITFPLVDKNGAPLCPTLSSSIAHCEILKLKYMPTNIT